MEVDTSSVVPLRVSIAPTGHTPTRDSDLSITLGADESERGGEGVILQTDWWPPYESFHVLHNRLIPFRLVEQLHRETGQVRSPDVPTEEERRGDPSTRIPRQELPHPLEIPGPQEVRTRVVMGAANEDVPSLPDPFPHREDEAVGQAHASIAET